MAAVWLAAVWLAAVWLAAVWRISLTSCDALSERTSWGEGKTPGPLVSSSAPTGEIRTLDRTLDYIFAGPFGTIATLTLLIYSAGFILFSIAIWRSGVLPRWAGVLVALHAPLISGPFSVVGSIVGALLALVGGGGSP